MWVASRAGRPRQLVLIQRCEKAVAGQRIALMAQLAKGPFVQCFDVFESGSETHLVLEPMTMSLVQIATALRFPSEQEVLAIVGQVRGRRDLVGVC